MYLRLVALAMDCPKEVLPTPGGPTRQSTEPLIFLTLFFYELRFPERLLTFCRSAIVNQNLKKSE